MKLRVVSYNIHKCIGGLDRRYRPERVVETIGHYDPDIVMLQEVDRNVKRSKHHDQSEVLAEMLGFNHHCWFPNVQVRGGGEYGNAIISKHPLIDAGNLDLTIPPKKKRGVIHCRYRVRMKIDNEEHTRTVHLFNMHLGLSQIERKIQLRTFLDSHPFKGLHEDTPIVVGGDLNDVYGNLGRTLLAPVGFRTVVKRLATFPSYAPMRALDGLYIRGNVDLTKLERSRLNVARQASDHLPLIADLHIPPP